MSVTSAEVRAFVADGHTQLEAAERFGLSRSKVQRMLRAADGERAQEVEALAETLGPLSAAERIRVGVLRTLAQKLDWAEAAPTGSAALALAALAKQYLDLLDDVAPPDDADMDWLGGIFADFDRDAMTVALRRIASGRLSAEECVALAEEALPRTSPVFAPVQNFERWGDA